MRAAFGFPLLVGTSCIGALNLFHDHPGDLTDAQHADAVAVAHIAGRTVLAWQSSADPGSRALALEQVPAHRAVVHQATGIVSVQADVSVDDALTLLRAYAFAEDRAIGDVAADVVAAMRSAWGDGPDRVVHLDPSADRRVDMAREQLLVETLVGLADTLVDDYDLIDFMQTLSERCVELLDVTAAGIMLADADARPPAHRVLEREDAAGGALRAAAPGRPVLRRVQGLGAVVSRLRRGVERRWPRFAPYARENGFHAVSAVPMRLRSNVIGALNLFSTQDARVESRTISRSRRRWPTSPPSASSRSARSATTGRWRRSSKARSTRAS